MTDTPWLGDACSLVEAFRSGERTPLDELDATLDAIERSDLNAFSYLNPEEAGAIAASGRRAVRRRTMGVKELDSSRAGRIRRRACR
jgi:aspartyl-tRNA(Asn)/glutamyl-tRNA(Gln) amidotransferase subunit A